MDETPAQLEYAPAPGRRRRWALVVGVLLLLVGAVLVWRYREPIADRGKLLIAQRRCLNYSPPAGQLVYESETARADALVAGDDAAYQLDTRPYYRRREGVVRVFEPGDVIWASLVRSYGQVVPYFSLNAELMPPPWSDRAVTVFSHGRRAAGHETRLVMVFLEGGAIQAEVIRPASMWRNVERISHGNGSDDFSDLVKFAGIFIDPQKLGVQIYAGQCDPDDESRFTIDARILGVDVRCVGRLLADDTVELQVIDYLGVKRRIVDVFK